MQEIPAGAYRTCARNERTAWSFHCWKAREHHRRRGRGGAEISDAVVETVW